MLCFWYGEVKESMMNRCTVPQRIVLTAIVPYGTFYINPNKWEKDRQVDRDKDIYIERDSDRDKDKDKDRCKEARTE
jgi:hypothetical protein